MNDNIKLARIQTVQGLFRRVQELLEKGMDTDKIETYLQRESSVFYGVGLEVLDLLRYCKSIF